MLATGIFVTSGVFGYGFEMGAVASVFEVIAERPTDRNSYIRPVNFTVQHNLILYTRRVFGLDWRYSNNCSFGHRSSLWITADHSARVRNTTVITILGANPAHSFNESHGIL